MLKFTTKIGGRNLLGIGLSFGNLDKFHREPLDTFIKIDGREMDIPFDVLLFSGESEAALMHFATKYIGRDTEVHIDPKLKS